MIADDVTLSVRDENSPSPLLTVAAPNAARLSNLRHVILIHGFANSQPDAEKSYGLFRRTLDYVTNTTVPERGIRLWDFHWPGDRPSEHKLFQKIGSAASYPARIGPAEQSGEALARLLLTLSRRQEVVLVAHSLGCRVALRCLKYLRELGHAERRVRVTAACLLAGAVPEQTCRPDQTFGHALAQCREVVLHSGEDTVLRRSFPLGQAIYGESGPAIGSTGGPGGRWQERRNTHLDHGDYWGDELVAQVVGQLLHLHGRVILPAHHLSETHLDWRPGLRAAADR